MDAYFSPTHHTWSVAWTTHKKIVQRKEGNVCCVFSWRCTLSNCINILRKWIRTGTLYYAFYLASWERDRIGCWSPSKSAKQLHANSRYKEVNKEQNGKWIAISIFQVISFLQKKSKKIKCAYSNLIHCRNQMYKCIVNHLRDLFFLNT